MCSIFPTPQKQWQLPLAFLHRHSLSLLLDPCISRPICTICPSSLSEHQLREGRWQRLAGRRMNYEDYSPCAHTRKSLSALMALCQRWGLLKWIVTQSLLKPPQLVHLIHCAASGLQLLCHCCLCVWVNAQGRYCKRGCLFISPVGEFCFYHHPYAQALCAGLFFLFFRLIISYGWHTLSHQCKVVGFRLDWLQSCQLIRLTGCWTGLYMEA